MDYYREHFIEQTEKEHQRDIFNKSVQHVIIELFSHCNRRCSYCPNASGGRSKSNIFMREDVIAKIIGDLQSIRYEHNICLNLYNEPLAERKYLLDKISLIRTSLPKCYIYFSSNGDYLTSEYLKELKTAGLNKLYITLHPSGSGDYDDVQVLNRFAAFVKKIDVLPEFRSFVLGRYISADAFYQELPIEIFSSNYKDFGQNRGGVVDIQGQNNFVRTTPCERPFSNFTISYDGTIFPCCQLYADSDLHKQYSVANISSADSIFEIYSNKKLATWRAGLFTFGPKNDPCKTCTEGALGIIDQTEIERRNRLFKELTGKPSLVSRVREMLS